jgi:Mg2+ and Co2+ transporter CorA
MDDITTLELITAYPDDLHEPRTLDQSYYSGLSKSALDARDREQVLSKQRGLVMPSGKLERPLLMVHQLWLWIIDDWTVITAFSERAHADSEQSLRGFIDKCSNNARRHALQQDSSAFSKARNIFSSCVNFIEHPENLGMQESLFSVYENAIGDVSNGITKDYKGFQGTLRRPLSSEFSIVEESEKLLAVKRLREELSMIKQVFEQQQSAWKDFSKVLERVLLRDSTDGGRNTRENFPIPFSDALIDGPFPPRMTRYILRVEQIDRRAESLENELNRLISLKLANASLKEARYASTQGKTVLVLTIITIIFTPLQFMTGLFALPVTDKFPQSRNGNGNEFSSGYLSLWLGESPDSSCSVT